MLEQRATRHQALLDFVASELNVEIAGESLDDLVEPEINRLQFSQLGGRLDLFVELLQFFVRIAVFHSHDANRTPSGRVGPILTMVRLGRWPVGHGALPVGSQLIPGSTLFSTLLKLEIKARIPKLGAWYQGTAGAVPPTTHILRALALVCWPVAKAHQHHLVPASAEAVP
ncbi:MAG: hypothetical protein ABSH42_11385 [Bryobacteraceae bacterium]|jgi:hypothetical protein